MGNSLVTRVRRGAVASAAVFALGAIGLTVASPAFAAEGPGPEGGDGKLTVTNSPIEEGGTAEVQGEGFSPTHKSLCFKIDDKSGAVFDQQLPTILTGQGTDVACLKGDNIVDANGNFSISLPLPTELTPGQHWVRVLDTSPQVSKFAYFNLTEKQKASTVYGGTPATGNDGATTLSISGNGFTEGTVITAGPKDKPYQMKEGRKGTKASATIGADGRLNETIIIPSGALPAGEHDVDINVGDNTQVLKKVETKPGLTLKPDAFRANASQGETIDFKVVNLPKDAIVTGVGENTTNWLKAEAKAALVKGKAGGYDDYVATGSLSVPADAALGAKIFVKYTVNGTSYTATTDNVVYPSTADINADQFSKVVNGCAPAGLYQSASDGDTAFMTSAQRVADSNLVTVDIDKAAVSNLDKDGHTPKPAKVAGTDDYLAVYGIGLDKAQKLIWVSNTRQNTVAVYDYDWKLVKQFPAGETAHSRHIVVDPTTHYAYVTSADRAGTTNSYVDVYTSDKTADGSVKVGRIELGDTEHPFRVAMGIDLDETTHTLYTTALSSPRAAAFPALKVGEKTTDKVTYYELPEGTDQSSGVGIDPQSGYLYLSQQSSANVLVLDTKNGGKVVGNVPTGYGSLNVAVDKTNRLVYVTNFFSDSVSVFKAGTADKIGQLGVDKVGKKPNHVSVTDDGRAIIVNKDGGCTMPNGDKGDTFHIVKFASQAEQPAATATVTFDANGGTPAPEAVTVTVGEKVAKPAKDPAKANFKFQGWFDKATGKAWNFDDPVTGDLTLVAHYEQVKADNGNGTTNKNGGHGSLAKTGSNGLAVLLAALVVSAAGAGIVASRRKEA